MVIRWRGPCRPSILLLHLPLIPPYIKKSNSEDAKMSEVVEKQPVQSTELKNADQEN